MEKKIYVWQLLKGELMKSSSLSLYLYTILYKASTYDFSHDVNFY